MHNWMDTFELLDTFEHSTCNCATSNDYVLFQISKQVGQSYRCVPWSNFRGRIPLASRSANVWPFYRTTITNDLDIWYFKRRDPHNVETIPSMHFEETAFHTRHVPCFVAGESNNRLSHRRRWVQQSKGKFISSVYRISQRKDGFSSKVLRRKL